ncbi:MAG: TrkA family potassium uptake protein [Dehalococcoidia bacterium]
MNVLIMGSGRLGAQIATILDRGGHSVTVLDINPASFRRLPETFKGTRAIGNGMDGTALERAGIASMDAFMAVTQGDNRNYFASQLAREIYHVPRVLCRIYDPVREEIFRNLGLETFSPTSVGSKVMVEMLLGGERGEG